MNNTELFHIPILAKEIISELPKAEKGLFLDVTAGGGGHFEQILEARPHWQGEAWDRDPQAALRINKLLQKRKWEERATFRTKRFAQSPDAASPSFVFILADIGVSSFQLDDPARGLSLFAEVAPDFRMDPSNGPDFKSWLSEQSAEKLQEILEIYGEEPKARKVAQSLKNLPAEALVSAKNLADHLARVLAYKDSRKHPATRVFQALRIAVNDELGELRSLLEWAPQKLEVGGRLAILSFHSLEDRLVKKSFQRLAETGSFDILFKKPWVAQDEELSRNPRAASAKTEGLRKGEVNSSASHSTRWAIRIFIFSFLLVASFVFHIALRTSVMTEGFRMGKARKELAEIEAEKIRWKVKTDQIMGPQNLELWVDRLHDQGMALC